MKMYGAVDVKIYVILTLSINGGDWSASRPWEKVPGTYWVGSRGGKDLWEIEKSLAPADNRIPSHRPSSSTLVAVPATG
jgi:hypothetical protein